MIRNQIFKRFYGDLVSYVPKSSPLSRVEKLQFQNYLLNCNNIVVLTGAGVSTESGIPDYRSAEIGIFNRTNYKPINGSEFLNNEASRVRYWARNYMAWPKFSSKLPNRTHNMLAFYEQLDNKISQIITQNVDGLHYKAGSRKIIELHGNAFWVQCLKCKHFVSRYDFQKYLHNLNPNIMPPDNTSALRPDGDVEITEDLYKNFKIPDCEKCGGLMKPAVVFFGDNVPKGRVKKVEEIVENCESLLVMGTTLSTLSSYRIVKQAYDLCKLIILVNIGPTKGDKLADLVINANCCEVFPDLKETNMSW
ncbi:hypothetical protein RUM44_012261 [Polyplax serrata]|uniref:Deacetylase sirtuin-type domain-containing protein n=1 Tax=Polyplax serrata TaxID=468196 RepID=A0ABR1BF79_POLSC